ncbi:uncharacterized protein sowahb isoform 2-T2 [Menidia menidia]
MATVFTQDSVLHFLQSNGGAVRNADLISHFRNFVRDHGDQRQNRELFKQFVNSVAIVKQIDGVSHVVLKKKFRGHVPGTGRAESPAGRREEPPAGRGVLPAGGRSETPAGRHAEPPASDRNRNPAGRADTTRPQRREDAEPAPPRETRVEAVLPAAGIARTNNNKVEANLNLKRDKLPQINEPSQAPGRPEPPGPDRTFKAGPQRLSSGPPQGSTPPQTAAGHHGDPGRLQAPEPGPFRGGKTPLQQEGGPQQEHLLLHQGDVRKARLRKSYKSAMSQDEDEDEEEVLISRGSAGRVPPLNAPLAPLASPPLIYVQPAGGEMPARRAASEGGPRGPGAGAGPEEAMALRRSLPSEGGRSGPPSHGSAMSPPLLSSQPDQGWTQPAGFQQGPRHGPSASPKQSSSGRLLTGSSGASGGDGSSSGLQARAAPLQPEGGPHQEHLLLHQGDVRKARLRKSYKSAVSQDEDVEKVLIGRVSAGRVPPLNAPLAPLASPPLIYVQPSGGEMPARRAASEGGPRGPGAGAGAGPEEAMALRRSLPSEGGRPGPPSHGSPKSPPLLSSQPDQGWTQPAGVQQGPRHGPSASPKSGPPPSSDAGVSSSGRLLTGSSGASGGDGSSSGLQARAGEHLGVSGIQEGAHQPPVTQAEAMPPPLGSNPKASWHLSAGNLSQERGPPALHRSTDHIYAEEQFSARGAPLHYSTGDLYDDYEDAESSDGSASSPQLRQRPAAAGRLSGRLRSRMCRSMGADLDQLLQEESRRGGAEAARLERLHQLSSSLSLHHHLSSSSLSSCATPPRCPSPAPVVDGQEMGEKRRSHSTTMHHGGQSQVPLDPREHDWMVKGAAGAWPDIYSLFREDASLLNRRDFICGFTVLHWIAKHGDHRVLNTLWYGVEKAGLRFDVNARSAGGQTPLHLAAMHGRRNLIRLLVGKFGADVQLRDTAGKRPWQYLRRGSPEVLQLLGAPAKAAAATAGGGGAGGAEAAATGPPPPRRRRRHHFSTASSGKRPLTIGDLTKVKRSTSIAALLKHKSLHRFYGHRSDSPI